MISANKNLSLANGGIKPSDARSRCEFAGIPEYVPSNLRQPRNKGPKGRHNLGVATQPVGLSGWGDLKSQSVQPERKGKSTVASITEPFFGFPSLVSGGIDSSLPKKPISFVDGGWGHIRELSFPVRLNKCKRRTFGSNVPMQTGAGAAHRPLCELIKTRKRKGLSVRELSYLSHNTPRAILSNFSGNTSATVTERKRVPGFLPFNRDAMRGCSMINSPVCGSPPKTSSEAWSM